MTKKYDFLVVGAGLFGATCAEVLSRRGYSVLVIDERCHVAGQCFTERIDDITVHSFGAHIFHTSNLDVWRYVNRFAIFNDFINSPIANYHGHLYNLPFNMNTFHQIWPHVKTPDEAVKQICRDIPSKLLKSGTPENLEQQAIRLVGKTIYKRLIKEYTEKQWGQSCKKLSPDIIKRLPLRFTYNNNYFNDMYQGVPSNGYTDMILNMLRNVEVRLNTSFESIEQHIVKLIRKGIIYSGSIDRLCKYCYGKLEYRSVRFEHKRYDTQNYQGVAVINYTDKRHKYTRSIEHKHFNNDKSDVTIVSYEYPEMTTAKHNPCYPINNVYNNKLYAKYVKFLKEDVPYRVPVYLGGRLGDYKYYDMDKTIERAFKLVDEIERNMDKAYE